MKEKINLLSKGIFSYDITEIVAFEDMIIKNVVMGTVQKGSFTIKNTNATKMKGIIYSSNACFRIITKTFVGNVNKIDYEIDASNLTIQDNIKGIITVITDCGELQVPYLTQVEAPYFETSLGRIKDLTGFNRLAKSNKEEAIKIFHSDLFESYIIPYDNRVRLLYRELIKSKDQFHGMDEFLVACKKKLPVYISVDKKQISYIIKEESIKDHIVIMRDNYGFTDYQVATDNESIQLAHSVIKADDFINNTYLIEFVLQPENMHQGKNYASINISSLTQTISVEVVIEKENYQDNRHYYNRILRPYQIKFGRNYIDFRKNTVAAEDYSKLGRDLLNELRRELQLRNVDHLKYGLLSIHLDIIDGRLDDAIEMLQRLQSEVQQLGQSNMHLFAAYQYLLALAKKDEMIIHRANDMIARVYEYSKDNFLVAWFLLYIDKRYDNNFGQRLVKLKEHFNKGCYSPALYFEAAAIYNEEATLLVELGNFELHVLNWAMKENMIAIEVARKIAYFAKKRKVVNDTVLRILFHCYDQYKEEDILITICSLLIRTHQMKASYHKWFELGVENNLRITDLYEYYMYTLEEKQEIHQGDMIIPKQVLLYFSYNSKLSDRKKAYVYAYVIMNKSYLLDVFDAYEERIFDFARKNITLHHISPQLSVIYQYYLKNHEMEAEIIEELEHIMFRYQIKCSNQNMKGAYVIFDELVDNKYAHIINGISQLDIHNNKYQLFLVDGNGNYYNSSSLYTMDQLFPWEEYIHLYYKQNLTTRGILSNLYHSEPTMAYEQIELRKYLLESSYIREEERMKNILSFIEYYYHNFDGGLLDSYLYEIRLDLIAPNRRAFIIELWILRGLFDEAIEGLSTYGMEGVDIQKLMKLCAQLVEEGIASSNSNMIANSNIVAYSSTNNTLYEEKFVTNLSYYIFKSGKYTVPMIEHLVKHYNGSTRELFLLWECAVGFELKTSWIEERLLAQMLFSQSLIFNSLSVFQRYYTHGSNYVLIRAYLCYQGFKYLMEDKEISEPLYQIMKKESAYEENEICVLALMKYESKQDFLDEKGLQFIDYNMNRYVNKGIVFPFYLGYKKHMKLPSRLNDKVLIEHSSNPKNRVYIYYRIQSLENRDFKRKPMDLMFLGVFVASFVLFHGETLEYYIVEELANEILLKTEIAEYRKEEEEEDGTNNRYGQINKIIELLEAGKGEEILNIISGIGKEKTLVEHLYHAIDIE